MINYQLDLEYTYKDIHYRVVQVLDNDLLLVVEKKDLDDGKYPLETVIIPKLDSEIVFRR